jgi:hypothetical protein
MRSALLAAAAAATAYAQSSMPSCMVQMQGASSLTSTPREFALCSRLFSRSPFFFFLLADLGVTYDLTDLMQQNQRIDDNRNETTSTWYDYYFGVCQDLGEMRRERRHQRPPHPFSSLPSS